jgi:hypothetical protein
MSDISDLRTAAYDFFWLFARFECAMKQTGKENGYLCAIDRRKDKNLAEPDWFKLKTKLAKKLEKSKLGGVQDAITYLTGCPPWVQKVVGDNAEFQKPELKSKEPGSQAIEAAKTVRNNLFHGGKCRPQSEQNRDPILIKHATAVLRGCLHEDDSLKSSFALTA